MRMKADSRKLMRSKEKKNRKQLSDKWSVFRLKGIQQQQQQKNNQI